MSPAFAAGPKNSGGTVGYDVSYPQCPPSPLPTSPAFGIVGVSDGLAYGMNACLAGQYTWAKGAVGSTPAFYMNTGNPGSAAKRAAWYAPTIVQQACDTSNEAGCAYDYGYNGAAQAYQYASDQTSAAAAASATWWLDVETANSWSTTYSLNISDIQGSIDFLRAKGVAVGIYSTSYQWGQITGGATLGTTVSNWVAGAANAKRAQSMCSSSFSGGAVRLVQYPLNGFDADYPC
jgi:hypothetical protein